MKADFYTSLMYARSKPIIGGFCYYLLKFLGAEIPRSVKIGPNCQLLHGGFGVVIHPKTEIGAGVRIYPGVTLGRADIHHPAEESGFEGIQVQDGAILCSGAKVLGKQGVLTIGKGSLVGANAVLLQSTGQDEIWAGIPARCVGRRE